MLSVLSEGVSAVLGLGGPVVMLLMFLAVVAVVIMVAKTFQFAALRINNNDVAHDALTAWRKGYAKHAIELLDAGKQRPTVRVVDAAMRGMASSRDEATVREDVTRIARNHVAKLREWLRVLEIIANLSPLLGLLGTVLGMIEAFKRLEAAGNQVDPAILSGGIWQALLTTAVGLVVAVPTLVAHHWLERQVERCAHSMEDCATRVFTTFPRDRSVDGGTDGSSSAEESGADLGSTAAAGGVRSSNVENTQAVDGGGNVSAEVKQVLATASAPGPELDEGDISKAVSRAAGDVVSKQRSDAGVTRGWATLPSREAEESSGIDEKIAREIELALLEDEESPSDEAHQKDPKHV